MRAFVVAMGTFIGIMLATTGPIGGFLGAMWATTSSVLAVVSSVWSAQAPIGLLHSLHKL